MTVKPFRQSIFPTYAPPPLHFVDGKGALLTTEDGKEYLDFIAGIAVNSLGHCHPKLVSALNNQSKKLWHLSNMFDVPGQQTLADSYCENSFADAVFFANSGTEAIECALKSARRFHHVNGATDRIEIIGFEGAFHGRTYAAVNAAGNPKYLEGFGPALPAYKQCPFGDMDALKKMLSSKTAAVIIEPVQGEGGLRVLPTKTLQQLRQLCSDAGALLIFDEVQSGAGRTGKLFAHQWAEGVTPDIMALAKGIGGGFPLGMCLATDAIAKTMVVGTHGTTYGGNALAVAVGQAVLDEINTPKFLEQVCSISKLLHDGLTALAKAHPDKITEVRGKGLLVGIKTVATNISIRNGARDRGLLVGVAGDNMVRLAPPLIITERDVKNCLAILDDTISSVSAT